MLIPLLSKEYISLNKSLTNSFFSSKQKTQASYTDINDTPLDCIGILFLYFQNKLEMNIPLKNIEETTTKIEDATTVPINTKPIVLFVIIKKKIIHSMSELSNVKTFA